MITIDIIQIITKETFEVLRLRQVFHTNTIVRNLSTVMTISVITDAASDVVKEKWIVLHRILPKIPPNH